MNPLKELQFSINIRVFIAHIELCIMLFQTLNLNTEAVKVASVFCQNIIFPVEQLKKWMK